MTNEMFLHDEAHGENGRGCRVVTKNGVEIKLTLAVQILLLTRQKGSFHCRSEAYFNRDKGFEWTIEVSETGLSLWTEEYPDDCPSDPTSHFYRIEFAKLISNDDGLAILSPRLAKCTGPNPNFEMVRGFGVEIEKGVKNE